MFKKIFSSRAAFLPRKRLVVLLISALAILFAASASAPDANSAAPDHNLTPPDKTDWDGGVILAYSHKSASDLENKLALAEANYFTVYIKADKLVTEHRAKSGDSIAHLLKNAGIVLGEDDTLSHFPHRPVMRGDFIIVERWSRDIHTVEEEIPFKTEKITTSLLSPGVQRVVLDGQNGVKVKTYERVLKDGVVKEKTILSEETVSLPSTRTVLAGEAGVPVSPLDFDWELDENGLPASYETVLAGQRAAGYSARPGAYTASGRKAVVGHVAVNPSVIPYGSKLYIQCPEGNFVYGYAIAADTGTALMQGIISVDLFYSTVLESRLNEIRNVDIYILEYPQ